MPQRQQITYTGSPFKWEPDKYGNIAFDYSKVGTGEGGARWGDRAHYQAVYPEISLENYALRYAPKNNNEAYMIQNITNPDTYYNLDLPLKKQSRFIRNIISNARNYTNINQGALGKILDNSQIERAIENNVDEFYKKYAKSSSYRSDWINSKEEAKQILRDNLYGTNYNHKSYLYAGDVNKDIIPAIGVDNYYKAYGYFENKGLNPVEMDYNIFNKKKKEFELEKILQENNGEIPLELLKDRKLERILDTAHKQYTLSPTEADYLGNVIKYGGGSGISPTSFNDDKIYVAKRGDFTHSFPVDSSLADEVAEAMVTHKGTDPFWNMYKENLRIPAIQQTHSGKTLEDIKQTAKQKQQAIKQQRSSQAIKQSFETFNKNPESTLGTSAKSITKVPLGARLYDAGLNPKELVKLAKDPKVLSEVTKSLGKAIANPKTYLELGRGLISPTNIGLIASDILVNKADQAVHNRLKSKYNIKSQAEFNKLYPTLSTFERGQLGNTYPEMYQSYMKGR